MSRNKQPYLASFQSLLSLALLSFSPFSFASPPSADLAPCEASSKYSIEEEEFSTAIGSEECSVVAVPPSPTLAKAANKAADAVCVSLIAEQSKIYPGQPLWLLIRLTTEPGWHLYWKQAGDVGFPPSINWHLPEGFSVGELLWPTPEQFNEEGLISFGYRGELDLLAPIYFPQQVTQDSPIDIQAEITWLACSDSNCLPSQATLSLSLPIKELDEELAATLFSAARSHLPSKSDAKLSAAATSSGFIALTGISKEHFPALTDAFFFPYPSTPTDYHFPPILTQLVGEDKQEWLLSLKASDEMAVIAGQRLQGELLLKSNTASVASWVIDLPIQAAPSTAAEAISAEKELSIGMAFEQRTTAKEKIDEPLSSLQNNVPPLSERIFLTIIFAFLGGFLLNFMPCVLPVIALKILSFAKMADKKRHIVVGHSVAFTAGILLSFWLLTAVMLLLQSGGRAVGWGFQLQNPLFVAAMALMLFTLSLNLLGVMELGTGIASWAGSRGRMGEGWTASFFSGIIATAVATPCTGPFLGTAIGFAATAPPLEAFLLFTAVALGLASPYLLLSFFPRLLRFLPKPGSWMIYFKQLMGFLLLASTLWLAWVFSAETSADGLVLLLVAFFFAAIGCWAWGNWALPSQKKITRRFAKAGVLMLFSSAGYFLVIASQMAPENFSQNISLPASAGNWQPFDAARVAALRQEGRAVFIDFTAKWCLTCQTNRAACHHPTVKALAKKKGVVLMKADWTRHDPAITEALAQFGRNSVPLYVLYHSGASQAQLLPQILTPSIIASYLEEIP